MKLASIISTWADTICLLPYCIANHLQFADAVIVVWSQYSNHRNKDDSVLEYIAANGHDPRVYFNQLEPIRGQTPLANETRKRNYGIDVVRNIGFSHFLCADTDEFYDPQKMNLDREMFTGELNGLVHRLRVYIGKPTLWCDDHTLVPGIHKVTKDMYVGSFREYPFAYDSKGNAHIDPSRRPFYTNGIKVSTTICHHMSYVRKDINLKINNSSANLKRSKSVILEELRDAKPGYVSRLYHQELKECENYFGIEI